MIGRADGTCIVPLCHLHQLFLQSSGSLCHSRSINIFIMFVLLIESSELYGNH